MPAAAGKFAFQTASTGCTDVAESFGNLPQLSPIEGSGKTIDAINADIDSQTTWEAAMQMKALDVSTAASEQHGVDLPLAAAPSVHDVAEAEKKFHESKGEAKLSALTAYREADEAHKAAVCPVMVESTVELICWTPSAP